MNMEMAFNRNMNAEPNTCPRRWMLVDDDADILALLASLAESLTEGKIECYQAPGVALAAFVAAPEMYDVIITDYIMPEMNGVELGRRIRAIQPRQKLFLLTGSPDMTPTAALQAGFRALLRKPFLLHVLENTLMEHIALSAEGSPANLIPA
jgi:CheY-like chemotaxis protein